MTEYTHEETQQHLREWVAALRSGNFPQAAGMLKCDPQYQDGAREHEGGYCCLGVGCEISGLGAWQLVLNTSEIVYAAFGQQNSGTMPETVWQYYGLPNGNPTLLTDEQGNQFTASLCNDMKRMSFAEIADLIEERFIDKEDM